jgi:uncharacterized protein with von Willebrand factor type A (vWA) domain
LTDAPWRERPLRRLVQFADLLRARGVRIGPHRIEDALRALGVVGIRSREDAYWAMRCTLTSDHHEVEVFDLAFDDFWGDGMGQRDDPAAGGHLTAVPATSVAPAGSSATQAAGANGDDRREQGGGTEWSALERLRRLDFKEYETDDFERARRLMQRVARVSPLRRSRRLRPAVRGPALDQRRTLRSALRTLGPPLERWWRRRKRVPRRLIFLVDVSGSMEPYARAVVMFLQAAVGPGRNIEAFTFGTRLTRITRELEHRDPGRALQSAARAVHDWAGGTRIGVSLAAFNAGWGRRGWSRGAAVVVVSDGWDRGDLDTLRTAMERLRREAHSIVWVNPVAGHPGYEPLARGMAASLPFVDILLPGHNLRSMEAMAEVLERLPSER